MSTGVTRSTARQLAALALFALLAEAGHAAEMSGELSLLMKSGNRPSRTAQVRDAVVFFKSEKGRTVEPGTYDMSTLRKQFVPHVLVVGAGSTVRFPNEDRILHNVFSVSGSNRFDLGLYNQGPGKDWTFEEPGVVRVYCNVHKAMAAYIVVLETPHFARPDAAGRYRLSGLPAGKGTLTVWHERAEMQSLELDLPSGPSRQDLVLRITKPRIAVHLNKRGRPYERKAGRYQ